MNEKMPGQVLIELNNTAFAYDGIPVTPSLNFSIRKGEYVSILGENGSGKTTLLKGLLRMKEPYRGEILFADEMEKQNIGYLPQQSGLQKDFPASVTEIVSSGRLNRHKMFAFYTREDRKAVQNTLRRLDIEDLAESSFRNLSGGQQQRVLLARALLASDGILLLDEPTAGLSLWFPMIFTASCMMRRTPCILARIIIFTVPKKSIWIVSWQRVSCIERRKSKCYLNFCPTPFCGGPCFPAC